MIREIINFVKNLEQDYPEVFDLNKKPSPGLHLWVELDEEGDWKNNPPEEGKDYVVYDGKNKNLTAIEQKAVAYQEAQDYLTMNKQQKFDMKQKIHSSSPFAISFNLSLGTMSDEELSRRGIKKKPNKEDIEENQKIIVANKKNFIDKSLNDYFKNARKIIIPDNEDILKQFSINFEKCYSEIIEAILNFETSEGKNLLQSFKEKSYVRIYLANVNIEKQKQLHEAYVSENIFNKDVFNIKQGDKTYGVANFMTTFSTKKPFLSHKTSFFIKDINTRLTNADALKLTKFQSLKGTGVLPNPLPIFIDKGEFKNNSEIVRVFNNEGERKFSYPQLLKKLHKNDEQRVLSNYYLLNINRGVVNDFDLVSSFQYKLNLKIENLFDAKYKELLPTIHLHTIFGFENNIVTKIFNNALVKKKNDAFTYNYFNDIDPNYVSGGDEIANLILRFRKAFYDYIYKSHKQAITSTMFDEIMLTSIISDMKHDESKDGYHTKETSIKEKLNIWFSLYNNFNNNSKNREDMAKTFKDLLAKMDLVANDPEALLDKEDIGEFLFATGQIIYFLLSKSKTSNPTFAILEPFLQKSNAVQLQNAIGTAVNMYKHELGTHKDRFQRLASQILVFPTDENLKNYQRYLLAGCFAPSAIYKRSKDKEQQEVTNN